MIKIIILIVIIILAISYLLIPLLRNDYFYEFSTLDEYHSINSGFIYFGNPDCPSCEGFKPILEKIAKKNMYKVYYFNLKYFTENNLITEVELEKILKEYKIDELPTLIEIINKERIGSITGEEHVMEQLEIFFDGSPFKGLSVLDSHNIINVIIYACFILIIVLSLFISSKYSKAIYILIFTLFIWNCINMWNYGVYIDENNASVTYHLGELGWINIFLTVVTFFTRIESKGGEIQD